MQVGALAARLGGRVVGDSAHRIDHVASLASAGPTSVAFLVNSALIEAANQSTAGVLLVDEHAAKALQSTAAASSPVSNLIVVDAPYVSFAQVARWLHPPLPLVAGTDAGANIDSRATLADSARVDANAVIGPGCVIADRVHIGAGCVLGANVEIGENSTLAPRVVVYDGCRIGQRCHVAAGAVLGKPGFGYHKHDGGWEHIPQLGGLRIGDDVDIGANTTIDRGTLDDTVIGNGVKLDNLIQIAHNVKIGDHTIMAAFVGVAGSATIGKRCMFGGRTSILGHIDIVDDVVVMATSFVGGHIDQPGEYSAALPVQKANVWRRNLARLRRLNKDAKPSR